MAALAPAYGVVIATALTLRFGQANLLLESVPYLLVSAVPLLVRSSRAFNGACYTAAVLLVCGGCVFGGVVFLPAALPLICATPPGLGAPVLQVGVATALAATVVALVASL
ncbi:hypothetical protein [Actinoplanes awajinensis]|nr:hypothetical protein [Actinoplanes awajinensis]